MQHAQVVLEMRPLNGCLSVCLSTALYKCFTYLLTYLPAVCYGHTALRYTTTDGQWKESAIRLTNTMVNVHAIINHFGPKIESWTTTHNLSSLTEEQVGVRR